MEDFKNKENPNIENEGYNFDETRSGENRDEEATLSEDEKEKIEQYQKEEEELRQVAAEQQSTQDAEEDDYIFDEGQEEGKIEITEEEAETIPSEEERQKIEEDKKEEDELKQNATREQPNRVNMARMYDTRERQVSIEALQMLYDARNPNHRGVLTYPVAKLDEYDGELCAIIYIPDVYTGVEGILRESKAGLSRHERMESLLSYPYVRVTPEWINREEGRCELNRQLAEQISASRAWKKYAECDDIDEAIVLGVRRNPNTKRPVNIVVDVHGVESILPIAEVSHNFVEEVNYKRGDVIPVRIIDKNEKTGRFYVSIRARYFNPWNNEHYIPKIGDPYPGVIQYESEKYLHILLHTGVKVLAPRPSFNYKGRDRVKEGEKVTVYITMVNREQRMVFGNMSREEAKKQIRYNKRRGRIDEMPEKSLIMQ